MFYCSNECQSSDWTSAHRIECKGGLGKILFDVSESVEKEYMKEHLVQVHLALRFVIKLKLDPKARAREYLTAKGQMKCLEKVEVERNPAGGVPIIRIASIWTKILASKYIVKALGPGAGSLFQQAVYLVS